MHTTIEIPVDSPEDNAIVPDNELADARTADETTDASTGDNTTPSLGDCWSRLPRADCKAACNTAGESWEASGCTAGVLVTTTWLLIGVGLEETSVPSKFPAS